MFEFLVLVLILLLFSGIYNLPTCKSISNSFNLPLLDLIKKKSIKHIVLNH